MEGLFNDLKYSLRLLTQNPVFTITAAAALTLGIGANTAVFSVVNAVLLRPLHVPDPDRIVQFALTFPTGNAPGGAPQHFYFWRQQTSELQDISAYRLELLNLTTGRDPEQIPAARVSSDFFHLFGAKLLYGRTFSADQDQPRSGHFAALSYRSAEPRRTRVIPCDFSSSAARALETSFGQLQNRDDFPVARYLLAARSQLLGDMRERRG